MKTPAFWYKSNSLLGRILSPLGLFYRMGHAWRVAQAQPYKAKIPVICVGNVVAGGSGKTPTALALAEILKKAGHKPVFVTRGYGGSARGVVRVNAQRHTASLVGDEALLLARGAPTWVGRDRVAAIKEAEKFGSHIILDDGLQNPNILPDISILVLDGASGIGNGQFVPAGPLRETLSHVMRRIHGVLMIGDDDHKLAPRFNVPVIAAQLEATLPANFPRDDQFIAFAGIARPAKFFETCRALGLHLKSTYEYSDHHMYSMKEMKWLWANASSHGARLITTEKDFVRLSGDFRADIATIPVKLIIDEKALAALLGITLPDVTPVT